jgi:DMSO/TMAO reductase YedYZ molybdopterin-dependent catalytic subunit
VIKGAESKSLTMEDLKSLPATEGVGHFMNSVGEIMGPFNAKGVSLTEICNLVGGMEPSEAARVVAKDGYAMTLSYKRLAANDFTTFDCATGKEVPHQDINVLLVYEEDGQPVDPESAGRLRLMVIGADTQATEGHWWVKWINEVEIVVLEKPWELTLEGAVTEVMDQDTFKSGANPGCHGATWTDGQGRPWEGIPLWLLVGRVDDDNTHEEGAFNDELADKGYEVHLIAADGYTVTFTGAEVKRNDNLIVAYAMDGEPIAEKNWPLRLVGDGLEKQQMIGQIAEIKIVFP